MTNKEEAQKVAEQVTNLVNNYSCDYKEFAKYLTTRTHRTLQQSVFRLITECITEWAKQENYDLRNEQTVKICKELVKVLEDKYLPYV